ncbi:MAG: ChuX/HutX family heme-like substrate-binding protein, partial [Succinivibrionaceae bacterium]|nr:ChuX/HutX family heme-like substrate-binding protein [Succinivibrionaceae bacterium]
TTLAMMKLYHNKKYYIVKFIFLQFLKSKLSSGKDGMGYYNIFASNDCALGGHINASNIKFIGFLELPFIKFKTANVTFFTEDGEEMFSVSVGRNAKHELLEEDLAIFNNLKESF